MRSACIWSVDLEESFLRNDVGDVDVSDAVSNSVELQMQRLHAFLGVVKRGPALLPGVDPTADCHDQVIATRKVTMVLLSSNALELLNRLLRVLHAKAVNQLLDAEERPLAA